MLAPRVRRLLALATLCGLLVGLMVGFGLVTPDPASGRYPDGGSLAVDYDRYVGESVQVTGTVTRTDPVVVRNHYSVWVGDRYRTGTIRLRVTDLDRSLRPGQTLQVYGTVLPGGTVRAVNTVVVPAANYLYMYTVSSLAGVWVLLRLVRGWTVDRATLAIRRRPTPLRYSDVVRSLSGGEPDA